MLISHLTACCGSRGGGISVALGGLVSGLHGIGVSGRVLSLNDAGDPVSDWAGIERHTGFGRSPLGLGFDRKRTEEVGAQTDVVHTHGLWSGSSRQALSMSAVRVVSPHGMVDPWALRRSRWKKRLALLLFERKHLFGARCVHALCAAEERALRDFGFVGPVAVIPNGVSLPAIGQASTECDTDRNRLVFLGRFNEKKGLDVLIRAWNRFHLDRAVVGISDKPWQLILAGWGEDGYVSRLKSLASELDLRWVALTGGDETLMERDESVVFLGPVFGEEKDRLYQNAAACVLPSLSEGLPMAVLESWSHGKAMLMTDQCNLPEGFQWNAAIRVEVEEHSIASGLQSLGRMSTEELTRLGQNGRRLVEERFTWKAVAEEFAEVYSWSLSGESMAPESLTLGR